MDPRLRGDDAVFYAAVLPMTRRTDIFFSAARMGFKNAMEDKIVFVGAFLIYVVLMLFYGGVLKMIPDADLVPFGFSHIQLVWYMGLTEFILFTGSFVAFKEVQNTFVTEQAHLAILRPAANAFVRFSFWSGESLARLIVLFPPTYVFLYFLAGGEAMDTAHIIGFFFSLPLASVMMGCGVYIIGASCLWFIQSDPAFWVWMKAVFLLGALMWPLAFYPLWLQQMAWVLPFHGILAQGGNWALDLPMRIYAYGFINQIVWAAIFLWFLRMFDRAVLRKVQKGGG